MIEQNMLAKGCGLPGSRQRRKKKRFSSTPGKLKGCVATQKQKTYCRRNRSWKYDKYEEVMRSLGHRKASGK